MAARGNIRIDEAICKECGLCVEYCPKNLMYISDEINPRGYLPARFNDGKGCNGCAICAIVCPEVAIEVYRG